LTLLVLFVAWILGDAFDVGFWRPFAVMLLGFLMSVPYGWAWVKGRAPDPPKPSVLVPQAAVHGERGSTYVLVGPNALPRFGLARKASELGPVAWFLYTLFWRWPLMVGDAVLTLVWRGIIRLFGFNGGPRVGEVTSAEMHEIDYPQDLPPPDRETF
jgi:hypothetical protein